jgi:phosphoglycolate phosphatase
MPEHQARALAVVFDLDGTLIDSAPDIHASATAVLREEGLAPQSFEQVRGFIGNGVDVLITRLLNAAGLPDEPERHRRMTAHFMDLYERGVNLTQLYPQVREALEQLRAAGAVLGLCTNKPLGPTRSVLAHFGLEEIFGTLICGDSLDVKKPDPAPLLQAQADLGCRQTLFVGDSEVDAQTADSAGLPFALFTEGYRKADISTLPHACAFSDFGLLPGLVDRMRDSARVIQRG